MFEATLIAGLGAAGRSDVLAALVMYRVIYSVLPFGLSVAGLAVAWVLANRQKASETSRLIYTATKPIIPLIAAGIAMFLGAVLLLSGSLPSDPARLGFFREIIPLSFIETSQLIASIVGVLLMIVARGLYRRMFRAWLVAIVLLAAGLVASLLKGFDWEEAVALASALALLVVFRPAFYRANVAAGLRLSGQWLLSVSLLAGVIKLGRAVRLCQRAVLWRAVVAICMARRCLAVLARDDGGSGGAGRVHVEQIAQSAINLVAAPTHPG